MSSDMVCVPGQPTPAPWIELFRSASYIDIAHKHEGLVAPTQKLTEIAYTPVCRIKRSAHGDADAALIMAAPDLLAACQAALEHCEKLREAWRTGALSEHDRQGGTRSNRNVNVEVRLSAAVRKATGR